MSTRWLLYSFYNAQNKECRSNASLAVSSVTGHHT